MHWVCIRVIHLHIHHLNLRFPCSASVVVFSRWCAWQRLCRLDHLNSSPPSARGVMWSTSSARRGQPGCSQVGVVWSLWARSVRQRVPALRRVAPSNAGLHGQRWFLGVGCRQRAQMRGGALGIGHLPRYGGSPGQRGCRGSWCGRTSPHLLASVARVCDAADGWCVRCVAYSRTPSGSGHSRAAARMR